MNEKGKNNYEKYKKNNNVIRIGVIGNENKGKSTILQKISNMDLPTGFSIKTEGLSIKYPELEKYPNLNVVLLDSAGLETPVLNQDENNIINNTIFLEQSRDKLLTEVFLQNYIIKNSDLLLLVFGKLTFEEQKLLNKVKNDIINLKRKEPLIVIHNLKEYGKLNQIEDYIQNILLKSSTFKLKESKEINKSKQQKNWKYYYEENSDSNLPKIFHFIYAQENSEAGEIFNKNTAENILVKCNDITTRKSFDIIQSIKETFCIISETILEKPLRLEDFTDSDNKLIKLNNKGNKIILKKCLTNELGFSSFLGNGFEPKYDYYVNENQFIINVEMPGDYQNTQIRKESQGIYTYIIISGNKINPDENEKIKYINKNRDYGEFNIRIKLEDINIEGNKPKDFKYNNNKGIATFIFDIKTESNVFIFN